MVNSHMSTTPLMINPSIEDAIAHIPIVLRDDAPTTPDSFPLTELPAIVERVRPFLNEIQNLSDYFARTLFEKNVNCIIYT